MRESRSLTTRIEPAEGGKRLAGYAAVWDSPAEISEWGHRFTEVIRKGAFARSLKSGGDVLVTFNHSADQLLGRTSSGTASFTEDGHGLRFEVELPDTETGREVRELARRGDLAGASFSFRVPKGGDRWADDTHRELLDLDLLEAGPVVTPAYAATSLALRRRGAEAPPLVPLRLRLALLLKRPR